MATTTNYSWTTPDDTDLVKDGAAAIRTLGSSADTTVKNLNPGTTAGDIDYYTSGTAKARIAIGTAGQVLQVNAGATAPEWAAPAGGGKVLQVVSALITTSTSIASTTLADSGITLNITPTSATSKVLVLISAHMSSQRSTDAAYSKLKILRDATTIWDGTNVNISYGFEGSGSGATFTRILTTQGFTVLDTPATTSAITYKLQAAANTTANSGSIVCQPDTNPSSITLMEIGA